MRRQLNLLLLSAALFTTPVFGYTSTFSRVADSGHYVSIASCRDNLCRPHSIYSLNGIRLYRFLLRPALPWHSCRMYPSCSQYSYETFSRDTFIKSYLRTVDRLMRCGRDSGNYKKLYVNGRYLHIDIGGGGGNNATASNNRNAISICAEHRNTGIYNVVRGNNPSGNKTADERLFAFANYLYMNRKYDKANLEYHRLISYYPRSQYVIDAYWGLYYTYYQVGKLNEAVNALISIADRESRPEVLTDIYMLIASRYFELDKIKLSRQYLSLAIDRSPDEEGREKAKMLTAITYAGEQNWKKSRFILSSILEDSAYRERVQELELLIGKGEDLKLRSPYLAGMMSIVPGLGYYYTGYRSAAVSTFIVNGLLLWGTYEAFNRNNRELGTVLGVCSAGWYAGNIYGAVVTTERANQSALQGYRVKLQLKLIF